MGCTFSNKVNRERTFNPIPDRFTSIEQVQHAIRTAGLESSNLILAVDFTTSNTWTGRETFNGRCLHDTSGAHNPYQQVIDIVGRTLEEFDDDRLIPAYGFGDSTTGDRHCFPFFTGDQPAHGVDEVLTRYQDVVENVDLAGPTSFAPVIKQAIQVVRKEEGYHILVIIADGQVTDASPTGETARAIIEASHYPLSIVVVGVGDGPWDIMEHYDDELPERRFDNFQFVDFTRLVQQNRTKPRSALEAQFALAALMEIPDQYAFIKKHGLLNTANFPRRSPQSTHLVSTPSTNLQPRLDTQCNRRQGDPRRAESPRRATAPAALFMQQSQPPGELTLPGSPHEASFPTREASFPTHRQEKPQFGHHIHEILPPDYDLVATDVDRVAFVNAQWGSGNVAPAADWA